MAAATLLSMWSLRFPDTGTDDADIFFAYARHLVYGEGFVYNVGGERVEGFTSLLWVLICAIAFRFSDIPERVLLVVNAALLAGLLLIGVRAIIKVDPEAPTRSWAAGAFVILLLGSPAFVGWMTAALMENALWALLLLASATLAATASLTRGSVTALCVCSGLLVITRPESMAWVPLFAAGLGLRAVMRDGSLSQGARFAAPVLVVFALGLASLLAFRLTYFGFPFPNTYYAKVDRTFVNNLVPGVEYLIRYFWSGPLAFAVVVSLMLSTAHFSLEYYRRRRIEDAPTLLMTVFALAAMGIPVVVGGDHFGGFRFYQNTLPLAVLAMVFATTRVLPNYLSLGLNPKGVLIVRPLGAAVVVCVLGFQLGGYYYFGEVGDLRKEFQIARWGRQVGTLLSETFPSAPRPLVGVITAGGIRLTYRGDIFDLMGLNSTVMAHSSGPRTGPKNHVAFDRKVFFDVLPEVVNPGFVDLSTWTYDPEALLDSFENRALNGLLDDDRFLSMYVLATVSPSDPS
ncbi:MAG: hypothetical protein PVF69_03390, partial [Gemmatimonadota bacterium]